MCRPLRESHIIIIIGKVVPDHAMLAQFILASIASTPKAEVQEPIDD